MGYDSVSQMLNAVDEDEKVKNNVLTLGGEQEMWFLPEADKLSRQIDGSRN